MRSGEIPRGSKTAQQRHANRSDVPLAAAFGHEAASWLQAPGARHGERHPDRASSAARHWKRRRQIPGQKAAPPRSHSARPIPARLAAATICGEESTPTTVAPDSRNPPGKEAVAASQVKNALARLWVQRLNQRLGEQRHETAMAGVHGCIPGLLHGLILERSHDYCVRPGLSEVGLFLVKSPVPGVFCLHLSRTALKRVPLRWMPPGAA